MTMTMTQIPYSSLSKETKLASLRQFVKQESLGVTDRSKKGLLGKIRASYVARQEQEQAQAPVAVAAPAIPVAIPVPAAQEPAFASRKLKHALKLIAELKQEVAEYEAVELFIMDTIKKGGTYDCILPAHYRQGTIVDGKWVDEEED